MRYHEGIVTACSVEQANSCLYARDLQCALHPAFQCHTLRSVAKSVRDRENRGLVYADTRVMLLVACFWKADKGCLSHMESRHFDACQTVTCDDTRSYRHKTVQHADSDLGSHPTSSVLQKPST